jgi:hypothetical protein
MNPTPAATYERAKRLANLSLWTIELQCRRIRSSEPEDSVFVFRKWADFDFLIVALTRLRRAAKLAAHIPEIQPALSTALHEFDSALPHLKTLRDVAEHIDDYAVDSGRERSIRRQWLEVSSISMEGPTLKWLRHQLNSEEALRAGQKLFRAIQEASAGFGPCA